MLPDKMPNAGIQKEIRMWPSLQTASSFFNLGNFLLIAGGTAGVVGALLIWWMGNVKEEYADNELLRSKTEMAEANARVAEANKAAAEANERSEMLASANLHLRLSMTPRRIYGHGGDEALFIELKKFRGTLALIQVVPDWEAQMLSRDIARILRDAGWRVRYVASPTVPDGDDDGVKVAYAPDFAKTNPNITEPGELAAEAALSFLMPRLQRVRPFSIFETTPGVNVSEWPKGAILVRIGMRPFAGPTDQ